MQQYTYPHQRAQHERLRERYHIAAISACGKVKVL